MNKEISPKDFDILRSCAKKWIGIEFHDDKKYLFENRLPTMVNTFGYDGIESLVYDLIVYGDNFPSDKKNFFIDIITTHETFFFRDKSPFIIMKEMILNNLSESSLGGCLKIYSAACSYGQEPLSILMQIQEFIDRDHLNLNFTIDAVDISLPCINKANSGVYTQYEIQRGLPIKLLNKYFKQLPGGNWKFKDFYRQKIKYQQANILTRRHSVGEFDVIFCRNVTIYMSKENVRQIYEYFHRYLRNGGWLIIGHSESMYMYKDLFDMVKCNGSIAYRKK